MDPQHLVELLETIRVETRRCYEASNSFTNQDRDFLLRGARALEGDDPLDQLFAARINLAPRDGD